MFLRGRLNGSLWRVKPVQPNYKTTGWLNKFLLLGDFRNPPVHSFWSGETGEYALSLWTDTISVDRVIAFD